MKNYLHSLLTVLVVLFSISAMSQGNLQILSKTGDIIANDSDLYVNGDTSMWELKIELTVKNISSAPIMVCQKKVYLDILSGTTNTHCFGGQCYFENTYISTNSVNLIAGASTDEFNGFSGHYDHTKHFGCSIIRYVFYACSNTNDSAWVNVHFCVIQGFGINESISNNTEISNPYPNPAKNISTFTYKLAQNTINAKFVLSDMIGNKVNETMIFDHEGILSINTSKLSNGLYFYSFILDDKKVVTKKLMVQH